MKKQSLSGSIDMIGLKKVGKGALIAGAGAVLTYALEAVPNVNFGEYTPIVMAIFTVIVNFARKWIMSYK